MLFGLLYSLTYPVNFNDAILCLLLFRGRMKPPHLNMTFTVVIFSVTIQAMFTKERLVGLLR